MNKDKVVKVLLINFSVLLVLAVYLVIFSDISELNFTFANFEHNYLDNAILLIFFLISFCSSILLLIYIYLCKEE